MLLNLTHRFRLVDKPESFYQFQEADGSTRDLTLKDVLLANLRATPVKERSNKDTKKRFWAIKKIKNSDSTIVLESKHLAFIEDCISPNVEPDIYGLTIAMLNGNQIETIDDFNEFLKNDTENNLFD